MPKVVAAEERCNQLVVDRDRDANQVQRAAITVYSGLMQVEMLLNPQSLPFEDPRRHDFLGSTELVSGLETLRDLLDKVLKALGAEALTQSRTGGRFWKQKRRLPRIPSKVVDALRVCVRRLVEDVAQRHEIDRGQIFSTGVSNGAFMSHRLAAEASDLIAAIAPVIGGMAPSIAKTFDPPNPVSILIIQGDADPLVPIDGGEVGLGRIRRET